MVLVLGHSLQNPELALMSCLILSNIVCQVTDKNAPFELFQIWVLMHEPVRQIK